MCSKTMSGKIMAMWPPIMGFILMGGEHCVANMCVCVWGGGGGWRWERDGGGEHAGGGEYASS